MIITYSNNFSVSQYKLQGCQVCHLTVSVSTLLLLFPKVLTKLNFIFYAANDNDSSSCRKCLLCVARSVNKTPTAAVLKEALETVSEIELLLHPGSFTISLAMFWRV